MASDASLTRNGESPTLAALNPAWTWRERSGTCVRPAAMETRHLFYTLRMIWNHAMPRHMTVGRNVKRWAFGPSHGPEYMREAILHIGAELLARADLAPWMLAELDQIRAWLTPRLPAATPRGDR